MNVVERADLTVPVRQKRIAFYRRKYVPKESTTAFEVVEKFLSHLERKFEVHFGESQIDVSLTHPKGTGRYQRWFGRPNLAGDIVQGGATIGSAKIDRSTFDPTMELFDETGLLAWRCRPLVPRRPGSSIGIFNEAEELHGRIYGENDGNRTLRSTFTLECEAAAVSDKIASRMRSPDRGLFLFLAAFVVAERLISKAIHAPVNAG